MASALIIGLVAIVLFAAFLSARELDRAERERQAWAAERRELLNRIQHPQLVPLPAVDYRAPPPEEPDGFDLVGTIAEASDQPPQER
jgi:hypothetical protein